VRSTVRPPVRALLLSFHLKLDSFRGLYIRTTMQRKTHLVAWDVVTKEKAQGGLGLRSMRQLNSAYLMKLGWRLTAEPSTLWARILKEKSTAWVVI